MLNVFIYDIDGHKHLINVPENLSEVKLSQKIGFDTYLEDLALWFKSEDAENNPNHGLTLLMRAVSDYYSFDLNTLLNCDVSGLLNEDAVFMPTILLDALDVSLVSALETTVDKLYAYAKQLNESYKFELVDEYTVDYNGKTWVVPGTVAKALTGVTQFTKITTRQAIEIIQLQILSNKIDSEKLTIDNEDLKNKRYTIFLNALALILREQDDDIDLIESDADFQQRVNDRIAEFVDIHVQLAYDALFFSVRSCLT